MLLRRLLVRRGEAVRALSAELARSGAFQRRSESGDNDGENAATARPGVLGVRLACEATTSFHTRLSGQDSSSRHELRQGTPTDSRRRDVPHDAVGIRRGVLAEKPIV